MDGNAIDRQQAKTYVDSAENNMDNSIKSINEFMLKIQDLSNTIKTKKGYPMYEAFQKLMDGAADFGNNIKQTFPQLHQSLIEAINGSGQYVDEPVSLNSKGGYSSCVEPELPYHIASGIKSYSEAETKMISVADAFKKINTDINSAITSGYQKLWWLADDSGYSLLSERAHEVADRARKLCEDLEKNMNDFRIALKNYVNSSQSESIKADQKAQASISAMYASLDSMAFTLATSDIPL